MHPAQIKAALAMASPPASQKEVALQCGVSPSLVYDVIHGNRRSTRVANRIAVITRLPLAELWPQWFGPNARRRRRPVPIADRVAAPQASTV